MGVSEDHELGAADFHLLGEGVVGGGGKVAGDNTDCVSVRIAGSTLGGITKCMVFSLRRG